MAFRYREEIVGKRFLCVSGSGKLKLSKICEWEWRSGVIRAASHKDSKHSELAILVEFDDVEWKRREWIRVYEENIFQAFLVEKTLTWAPRKDPRCAKHGNVPWPALSFIILVDKIGLKDYHLKPVEYLVDKVSDYLDYTSIKYYQEGDDVISPAQNYADVKKSIKQWIEYQDGQRILLTTPSVLVGERVEVYRVEGTTQWYTAVIGSYNENTRELAVTDDTVLEEHNEDPCLVQMRVIGDGVIESILKGENTGITPRRRTCTLNNQHLGHYIRTRPQNQSPSHSARFPNQISSKKSRTKLGDSVPNLPLPAEAEKEKIEKVPVPRERKRKTSANESTSPNSGDLKKVNEKNSVKKSKGEDLQHQAVVEIERNVEFEEKDLKKTISSKHYHKASDSKENQLYLDNKDKSVPGNSSKNHCEALVSETSYENETKSTDDCNVSAVAVSQPVKDRQIKKIKVSSQDQIACHLPSERVNSNKSNSSIVAKSEETAVNSEKFVGSKELSSNREDLARNTVEVRAYSLKDYSVTDNLKSGAAVSSSSNVSIDSKSEKRLEDCDKISDSESIDKASVTSESAKNGDERCASRSSEISRLSDERSASRLSVCEDSNCNSEEKTQQSEELSKQSGKDRSPEKSTIVQKSEPVYVWRDPKLVNSDNTVRHVHSLQHSLMAHSTNVTHGGSSVYSGVPVTSSLNATSSHPPTLPQHSRSAMSMSHYPQISTHPHVISSHPAATVAVANNPHMDQHGLHISGGASSTVSTQQNYSHLLSQHGPSHLLPQYSGNIPVEMLWQQKYPPMPVTSPWMPMSYQDERARMDRERRDLVERERLERDRHEREKEKERMEREKQEQEHLKRMKIEQTNLQHEQERAEREKAVHQRAQIEAVHQHFEESFRLAGKKKKLAWSHITGLPPKVGSNPMEQLNTSVSVASHGEKHGDNDPKGSDHVLMLQKKESKEGQHNVYTSLSDDEKCQSQENDKWLLGQQQQQQQIHQSQKQPQLQQNTGYPYNEVVSRPNSRSKVEYPTSTSHSYSYNSKCVPPPQTVSPAHLPKAEPSFSLYGYQPFQHGYIIQDKLPQNKPSGNVHDHKSAGMANLTQSQVMASNPSSNPSRRGGLPSPPPLLSSQEGPERKSISSSGMSSVIVSNEPKSVSPHSISPKQQHRLIQNQDVNMYGSSGQTSGGMISAGTAFKPYEYNHSPSPSQSPHSRGPISHHSPLPQQLDLSRGIQKSFVNTSPPEMYASPAVCLNSSVATTTTGYTNANINISSPSHFTTTTTTSHGHSSMKPVQTTYAHNLIQQGLVPNPIYSPSCTGSMGSTVSSAVVTSHSPLSKGCTQVNSLNSSNPSPLHLAYTKPGIMSGTPIPRMSSSPRSSHSPVIQQSTPPAAHYNNKLTMDSGSHPAESHSPGRMLQTLDHSHQGTELLPNSVTRGIPLCNSASRDSLTTVQSHIQSMCKSPSQISPVSSHHSHAPSSHLANVQYVGGPYSPSCPNSTSPSSVQMQPLNLQNPERLNPSASSLAQMGKRKAPKDSVGRKRTKTNEGLQSVPVPQTNPVLARVGAPSPLMVNAATTITTVMNTIAFPSSGGNDSINTTSSISSTANVTVTTTSTVTTTASTNLGKTSPKLQSGFFDSYLTFVNNSASQKIDYQIYNKQKNKQKTSKPVAASNSPVSSSPPPSSVILPNASGAPSPITTSNPGSCTPSNNVSPEPDKSMSPTLSGSTNPVTKLKKAWLQRHSDEDTNRKDDFTPTSEASLSQMTITEKSSSVNNNSSKHQERNSESNAAAINGHDVEESGMMASDDSTTSASEQEVEPVTTVKRLGRPAKIKTAVKEGKRQKKNSENLGDSTSDEKQEVKMKEESLLVEPVKQPKKRGRKPKPKPEKEETIKKSKSSGVIDEKPSIAKLRRTGESFLQNGPCCEVAPKLSKCRECRMTPNQRNKKMPNIFCRFYAFRRLKYSKNGFVASAGFSEPKDATDDERKLWLPQPKNLPPDLDLETSKFLVSHVGNQFCDLVEQEKEAQNMHLAEDDTVAWKRVVQGVREMCDVCETTLFNIHWACNKCGFVVCIDCYKARKNGTVKCTQNEEEIPGKDRDSCWWLLCNNRQPHEQNKLMLTQIIADQALWEMGKLVHSVRERWNIPMHCACIRQNMEKDIKNQSTNGICKQLMSAVSQCFNEKKAESVNGLSDSSKSSRKNKSLNGTVSHIKQEEGSGNYNSSTASPLCWLADVALNSSGKLESDTTTSVEIKKEKEEAASESKEEHFSTLRELLIRPTTKSINNSSKSNSCISSSLAVTKKQLNTLDDVINCMIEQSVNKQDDACNSKNKRLLHYMRRYPQPRSGWEPLPIRIFTLAESTLLFPDVNHSWLCEGRLLQLHDPTHEKNIHLFQEQWKRGQPVLVSEVNKALDMKLWHPEAFARDFGDIVNDLVNCHNGNIVQNHPMRKFWEGFENFSKRMKDETGEYMLLKLKDWPPGDDFSEMLPSRFKDLMKALPLPEYTHRNGKLNLAGRLPDCFVRPDLGPKMYNAYGSALYPSKGTTNLHLDISDAVNVMVYVGIPKDGNDEQHIQEALRAIDEAGCDILTRQRVREKGERPGALWHIYNARDADKIRDLLNKVALEKGEKLEPHHDPIHDQSWYLDSSLRERLYCEYGVEGYAIAQCLGDAVFIPAGAPHQVRNLHSCIKVAEDFVSPENVSHCFTLTQEFRDLSDTHTNHEDKLQVKNIIYHAVKDALSVLLAAEGGNDAENKG